MFQCNSPISLDSWPPFFKAKMSDAFAILSVIETLVEALQIDEQCFITAQILSRFSKGRLMTLNLLSRGRNVSPYGEKQLYFRKQTIVSQGQA